MADDNDASIIVCVVALGGLEREREKTTKRKNERIAYATDTRQTQKKENQLHGDDCCVHQCKLWIVDAK